MAFGTSIPTSITDVATSTSAPPGGERGHHVVLLARPQLAVHQHDPEVAQLAVAQPLELGRRGARLEQLRLGDQRADDERLAAGAELVTDPVVGAGSLALGRADERLDRLASLRAARAGR